MMSNEAAKTSVSDCGTYHLASDGKPLYQQRYDTVLPFHPPGLAPVSLSGHAWHIRSDGRDVYKQRFDRTFGFYCGVAAICQDECWFHIDPEGLALYQERYVFAGNFQEDVCVVCDSEGRYFHIDLQGKTIYPEKWRYCGDFREGVAVVQNENGLSTHIDKNGVLIHGLWFEDLDVFHKGYARARESSGWHHIDKQGRSIYGSRYANVEPFYNGFARVEGFDGSLIIINEAGKTIRRLRKANRSHFQELSSDMVGYWKTLTLSTASKLNLVDNLPATPADLARKLPADPARLQRLLRALGELEITVQSDGVWSLSDKGQYLSGSHPLSLASAADEYGSDLLSRWLKLPEIISGEAVSQDIFDAVAEDEHRCLGHHKMLSSYALHDYQPLLNLIDFKEADTVFDAAGGVGALGQLIQNLNSKIRVVCGDKQSVIPESSQNGVEFVEFDLFQRWPLTADKVILARVLHDWNDEQAIKILSHARQSLKLGGEVIVFEMVLSETSFDGALCDLHLLAVTGGQERTLGHFKSLLNNAGLELLEAKSGAGHVNVLRAKCAQNQ